LFDAGVAQPGLTAATSCSGPKAPESQVLKNLMTAILETL